MNKVAILTQPMHINYGGMLQAYALTYVLKNKGFQVEILNRRVNNKSIKFVISNIYKQLFKNGRFFTTNEMKLITKNTDYFIENYLNLTKPIYNDSSMKLFTNYDIYVVGSDQCWRPKYSPSIYNYFLDFLPNDNKSIKISYAASLGTDEWEFTEVQETKCNELIKKFDLITFREDSGVELFKNKFNVESHHVLDPTLLVNKIDYISLVKTEGTPQSPGNLFYYILDKNKDKLNVVDRIETILNLTKFEVMPKCRLIEKSANINDYVYPSTFEWIRSYMDSKFVVTDSFHGTVFSIIFNIPFISISNKGRGNARFYSLLKLFGLENRLISDVNSLNLDLINNEIDWESVNKKLNELKIDSLNKLFSKLPIL